MAKLTLPVRSFGEDHISTEGQPCPSTPIQCKAVLEGRGFRLIFLMNSESTLARLQATLPDGKLPSSYGVYFKNTLVALCHALEDHILQTSSGDNIELKPLVLVTFQQGKWYYRKPIAT